MQKDWVMASLSFIDVYTAGEFKLGRGVSCAAVLYFPELTFKAVTFIEMGLLGPEITVEG